MKFPGMEIILDTDSVSEARRKYYRNRLIRQQARYEMEIDRLRKKSKRRLSKAKSEAGKVSADLSKANGELNILRDEKSRLFARVQELEIVKLRLGRTSNPLYPD